MGRGAHARVGAWGYHLQSVAADSMMNHWHPRAFPQSVEGRLALAERYPMKTGWRLAVVFLLMMATPWLGSEVCSQDLTQEKNAIDAPKTNQNPQVRPAPKPAQANRLDVARWLVTLIRKVAEREIAATPPRNPFGITRTMHDLVQSEPNPAAAPPEIALKGLVDDGRCELALLEVSGRVLTVRPGDEFTVSANDSLQLLTLVRIDEGSVRLQTETGETLVVR